MQEFKKEVNPIRVLVKVSDGTQISGTINVRKDFRVSDMFTKTKEPFVVLFGASLRGQSDKVAILNKEHIIFVIPED